MIWYVDYVHIELTRRIYIYIMWIIWRVELWCLMKGPELCALVMMGWLSKLIVVDNLECPNINETIPNFWYIKKNYPQIKRICCDFLTLNKLYSRTITLYICSFSFENFKLVTVISRCDRMKTPTVKPLGRLNSDDASSPRATATDNAWVHAPPRNPNSMGDP